MSGAKTIDYTRPAEVFWCASAKRQMPKGSLRFRKFATLDAAVRFLVADKSEKRFQCTIDTETAHYEGGEIEDLFDRPDFPASDALRSPQPSRRIGIDFFSRPEMVAAYAITRDDHGTWTVTSAATGETVSINDVDMNRMSLPDAERMMDVLNSADGPDMLALGP
ncbi:hypothetical protein [Aureimonas sp. Leaf324]|uniref:hypothetical protein n=1 Tax=Aureimonas sp. Leaf324 TaxID=1736336 RepID=UPI0006F883CC|nr:hypothetical protein [Aureimonas sp. Leaf324]KQQ84754.1 hypothetical protein ASF65_20165 [Aureimonas sp. Leaf324]